MIHAVETFALTKRFPANQGWRSVFLRDEHASPAVDEVNLHIRKGELLGLVGPNGAGKTTLIKMLSTLILPTTGSASINGFDLDQHTAIKASIGLVTSDERSFYWRLTGRQNLAFFAALHHLSAQESQRRVAEMLAVVDLLDVADRRFLTYSTGMRQRLSIARALLNQPQLLFLDEPTKGLDPLAIQSLHRLIREQLVDRQGITILLTSHWLTEVERLCDRIAIMNQGRILACGTLEELRQSVGDRPDREGVLELTSANMPLEQIFSRLVEHGPQVPDRQDHLQKARLTPTEQHGARKIRSLIKFEGINIRTEAQIFWAFLKRDYIEEASYRVSFGLQFLSVFFSAAVFFFISRLLGDAVAPFLEPFGGDYFSFVLIGIAFAGYFNVGLSSFSTSLRQAQTTGTLEAMLTTPTHLSTIVLASSLWSYLLTSVRVIVYLIIGAVFLGVDFQAANYLAALLVLAFTILAFSSLGIIAASFIMVLKRGDPFTWMVNSVASLLGGVYYPISILPGWMQSLAYLLPITFALRAMRQALLQGATPAQILPDLVVLAIFGSVLLPVSLLAFRFAVRRARIDGSLTHY